MKKEKTYLNQLLIYFTLKDRPGHLYYNFPTWPPSRVGKHFNTGNDEFNGINKILSAHLDIPFLKEEYCHPNFPAYSIGQIDNSILYQTLAPLKAYFLDELPTFDIHNVVDVSFINMFHVEVILTTADTLSFMDSEFYQTPSTYYELGFSYITSTGYIQRISTISRQQLQHKAESKFLSYPAGYLEYYIQTFMVYPYFINQNMLIELEHLPSK